MKPNLDKIMKSKIFWLLMSCGGLFAQDWVLEGTAAWLVFEPILEVHLEQSLPWGYFGIVTLATVHDSLLQKHVGALDFAKLATTLLK